MDDQAAALRALAGRFTAGGVTLESSGGLRRVVLGGGAVASGTTTVALGLAYLLSKQGQKVLLVDATGRRGDLVRLCNLDERRFLRGQESGNNKNEWRQKISTVEENLDFLLLEGREKLEPVWQENGLVQMKRLANEYDSLLVDVGESKGGIPAFWGRWSDWTLFTCLPKNKDLIDLYAKIKLLLSVKRSSKIATLFNQVCQENVAELQGRLNHSCLHFLGFAPEGLGGLSWDQTVSRSSRLRVPYVVAEPEGLVTQELDESLRRWLLLAGEKPLDKAKSATLKIA
ncbi:MAG: hypothetical protein MPJ24_09650 [Pirellulaceae bacterium]|nr:hypothetical protein [Pirellulaceae bacterium]